MSERKALTRLECGWVTRFDGDAENGYTIGIAFKPELRMLSEGLAEFCRGVEYWAVKLDGGTAAALQKAFDDGGYVTYDPELIRRVACHKVPWQQFHMKVAPTAQE